MGEAEGRGKMLFLTLIVLAILFATACGMLVLAGLFARLVCHP